MANTIFKSYYYNSPAQTLPDLKKKKVLPIREKITDPLFPSPPNKDKPLERTCTQNQEKLIRTSSLLNKKCDRKAVSYSLAQLNEMLVQIHANDLMVGSTQTIPSAYGIHTMLESLRGVRSVIIPSELLASLEQYQNTCEATSRLDKNPKAIAAYAKEVQNKIFALKTGQTFLIEVCPIVDGQEKPILFEFKRNADQTLNLSLHMRAKKKWKYKAYVPTLGGDKRAQKRQAPQLSYEKIAQDKFSLDFFQAMLEVKVNPEGIASEVAAHDLLEHLFKDHYPLPFIIKFRNNSIDGWMSKSKGKNDVWFALKAFVFKSLPKEIYKPALLEIKLNTLVEGYKRAESELSKDTAESERLRLIFQEGAKRLLKALLSINNQKIPIAPELIKSVEATALDLQKRIASHHEAAHLERAAQIHHFSVTEPDKKTLGKGYSQEILTNQEKIFSPIACTQSIISSGVQWLKCEDPKQFPMQLQQFMAQKRSGGLDKAFILDIEHLVSNLPIPQNEGLSFWNQIPKNEIGSLISNLNDLLLKYYNTIGQRETLRISAEAFDTVLTLYTIISHLALVADKEKHPTITKALASFSLYLPNLQSLDEDPFFVDKPKLLARRKEIIEYFHTQQKQTGDKILFDLSKKELEIDSTFSSPIDSFLGSLYDQYKLAIENYYNTNNYNRIYSKFEGVVYLAKQLGSSKGIFQHLGLGHIPTLLHAMGTTHQFSTVSNSFNVRAYSYEHQSSVIKKGTIYFFEDNHLKKSKPPTNASVLHPPLKPEYQNFLTDCKWNKRVPPSNTQLFEAESLEHPKFKGVLSDTNQLLRASSDPSLYLRKLIEYYQYHLDLFESIQEQTLFEILFFRSLTIEGANGRSTTFPFIEELKQPSFRELLYTFLQEGIDRYFIRQPNKRPQVHAVLFFLRIVSQLSPHDGQSQKINGMEYINEMFKIPDLTPDERSALSLHRLLLFKLNKKELTSKELEVAFSDWIFYKNTPLPLERHNPLLENEAEQYIHAQSQFLYKCSEEFFKSLIAMALSNLSAGSLDLKCHIKKESHYPHIITAELQSDFWQLNLLTGQVLTKEGILSRAEKPEYLNEKHRDYSSLFGKKSFNFLKVGNTYYFEDPQLGAMRTRCNTKYGYYTDFALQRNIESNWYQFVSRDQLKAIPRNLVDGHYHWIHTDKNEMRMVITDKKGQTVATIHSDKGWGTIKTTDGELVWDYSDPNKILERIEPDARYIYLTHNSSKGTDKVTFARYFSQAGQPLSFLVEKGRLVYRTNQQYAVSSTHKNGVLGGIDNYLLLQPLDEKEKTQKILVPFQFVSNYSKQSSKQTLNLQPLRRAQDEPSSLVFFEYDVVFGNVTAQTQEGTLFLAYLYLTEGLYKEAVAQIQKISPNDRLSDASVQIMNEMIQLVEKRKIDYEWHPPSDPSVEGAAVVMHAAWLYTQSDLKSRISKQELPKLNSYRSAQKKYESTCHRLSPDLLLNEEQRIALKLEKPEKDKSIHYELSGHGRNPNYIHSLKTEIYYKKDKPKLPYPKRGLKPIAPGGIPKYPSPEDQLRINLAFVEGQTNFLPYTKDLPNLASSYHEPYWLTQKWDHHSIDFIKSFFYTAYQIIKKGNPKELEQLEFRLQLTKANSTSSTAWRYLQYALLNPQGAPEIPTQLDDPEARLNFIIQLSALGKDLKTGCGLKSISEYGEFPPKPIIPPILPAKEAPAPIKQETLHLALFSKEAIDGGFSSLLFDHCLKADPSKQKKQVVFSLPELKLTEEEKVFEQAIRAECEAFKKDYAEGVKINAQTKRYRLENESDLSDHLKRHIQNLDNELIDLEVALLELANRTDPKDRGKQLSIEAGLHKEITLRELAGLFLEGNVKKYVEKNPYLKDPELVKQFAHRLNLPENPHLVIDYLYNLMGLYMTMHVHRTKLARIQTRCTKIKGMEANSLARDAEIQLIASELMPLTEPIYNIHENPELLVFEYLSKVTLRKDQAPILKKLLLPNPSNPHSYLNRVFQMMMGGGKTTVIAVMLLKMAAKEGRLSLFITPASQYGSVRYNLRKALFECFGQEMEEIDVTRQQLNLSMCKDMLSRLQSTIKKGNFLLVKAETLQALELEFLDRIYKVCDSKEIPTAETLDYINTLKKILIIFRTQGDALIDEVDLVLNVLQEVNFPVGKEEHVLAERIHLIRSLFEVFTSEKIRYKEGDREVEINIKELIGLEQNEQKRLSKDDLYGHVAKAVAYHLGSSHAGLLLKRRPELHTSFYRYISGKMNTTCQKFIDSPNDPIIQAEEQDLEEQDRTDLEFLRHLKNLRASSDPETQEASHQIALIKHMMLNILPLTFKKTGKRHYGRGGSRPGETRFYHAVGTPSENLFGHHWEAAAYHFQTALQMGISEEQIIANAKVLRAQAETQSAKEKIPFEDTLEATEFRVLTGVGLHEIDQPEKMKEALAKLNQNVQALLKFEAETAADLITYFPYRLTSTGLCLLGMLYSTRAMSATPWNLDCFDESLADHYDPALGTEGRIADAVLSSAATRGDKDVVHLVEGGTLDSVKIEKMLTYLYNSHPNKDSLQLLMDPGALFKDADNLTIAKILSSITKKDVLYFARDTSINEQKPNTLFVWKFNSGIEEKVGGKDNISNAVKEGEYVVYLDEQHTTGIDLPFLEDAIGLMTVDEEMYSRTFFQALLRFRSFFLNQSIEFIIPKHLVNTFKIEGVLDEQLSIVLGILMNALKNQAIAKSKHYYRSCKQKIDNAFRQPLMSSDGLLCKEDLTADSIRSKFIPFQTVTLLNQSDAPYDQFGRLEYEIESLKALQDYCTHKLAIFKKSNPPAKALKAVEDAIKKVLQRAATSPFRPREVFETASQETGTEVDVLTEVANQIQNQVDQDVSAEILRELNDYKSLKYSKLIPEKQWSQGQMLGMFEVLLKGEYFYMQELSKIFTEEHFAYKRDFTPVFSDLIYVSASWIHATDKTLPVFHEKQRALDNLLIIQTPQGFRAVALSLNEAGQFRQFLKEAYQKNQDLQNVWLIQPSSLLEENPHKPLPKDDPNIRKILLESHVFNGKIDALDTMEEEAVDWLYANKGQSYQIRRDFLQLKIAEDPVQKKLFFTSDIFGDPAAIASKLRMRSIRAAEKLKGLTIQDVQNFTEDNKILHMLVEQVDWLAPHQVEWLLPFQIPLLTKRDLIQAIPKKYAQKLEGPQLGEISENQVLWYENNPVKTQEMPATMCPFMSDRQLVTISGRQVGAIEDKDQLERLYCIAPDQLSNISAMQVQKGLIEEKYVPYMRNPKAIAALPVKWLHHVSAILRKKYLCEEQVSQFNPYDFKQARMIHDLTERQVAWLKNEKQLAALKTEQIKWITPSQIERIIRSKTMVDRLLDSQIEHIHPEAAEHIPSERVQFLGKIGQVRALDPEMFAFITDRQAMLLEGNHFDVEIFMQLNLPLRQKNLAAKHVKLMHPQKYQAQITQLTEAQVPWLVTEEQIKQLWPQQIAWMTPLQIENLVRSKEMVDRLLDSQIQHIDPVAVRHLPAVRLRYLGTIEQVRSLEFAQYPYLKEAQAKLLQDQDFDIMCSITAELREKYLRPAHVAKLDPAQHVKHIQTLTENQVPWLINEEQLKLLADHQVMGMSPDQISLIQSQEMVDRLHESQIQHIHPNAVQYLHEEDVTHLRTIDQIRALPPEHYPLLESQHVTLLDPKVDQNIIEHLDAEQLNFLQNGKIGELEDSGLRTKLYLRSCYTPTCKKVIGIVGIILVSLIATAALVVGCFAIMGAHASFAPQFMIDLYHMLHKVEIAYTLAASGGAVLIGLVSLAIYHACQPPREHHSPSFVRIK